MMLKIIVNRTGVNIGLSPIAESPHKFNTFNPYNTFMEFEEDLVLEFKERMDKAKKVADSPHDWPEMSMMMTMMMMKMEGIDTWSSPFAGALPGVHTAMTQFIIQYMIDNPKRELTLYTVSEYCVRYTQLCVARKQIPIDFIKLYDQENVKKHLEDDFNINDYLKDVHEYEGSFGSDNIQVNIFK